MESLPHLDVLMHLFERLGVTVRRETLGGEGGGLCMLRGQRIMFLDTSADEASQIGCCLRALGSIPELESMYIPPALREAIDHAKRAT
jgi:hypothetical protein